jgi:DNA-binding NarL/FixJ family response regulator
MRALRPSRPSVDRIRIVLVTARPILESIVLAALASETAVEVVGTFSRLEEMETFLSERAVELAIVDVGTESDSRVEARLLHKFPRLRLLAIGGDGRTATLHELRPHATPLGEISPERLRQAIR